MAKPTVAIVGASANRQKFGNKSLRAHVKMGFDVFAVNPRGGEIEGQMAFTSLREVPVQLDRISMYVSPDVGLSMLDQIVEKGCKELWLNPGSASREFVQQATQKGLNVIEECSIVAIGCSPSEFP